jgi:hypothetical protein
MRYFILTGLVVAFAVRADNVVEMFQSYKLGTIILPISSFTRWREWIMALTAALTTSAQMRTILPWFALKPFPQQVLHQLSSKPYVVHILFINYVH